MDNPSLTATRPKIGLALAGASSRSVFYIGFLEVMSEKGFTFDYIAATSGGSIVAAAYACGSLKEVKEFALNLNKELVFSLVERSKGNGGLYHLEKAEEFMRRYTKNLRFEDVRPRMGFVTADITQGEAVVLEIGDIARAVCASCTLPWVFEPVAWGNKLLLDGGLVSVVPGKFARQAGMDLVIGINLRNTMHIFSPWQIFLRKVVKQTRRMLFLDQASQAWQRMTAALYSSEFFGIYSPELFDDKVLSRPGLFGVLGRALDLAIKSQQEEDPKTTNYDCDYVIMPDIQIPFWKKYLYRHFTDFSNVRDIYELGRRTAEEQLPALEKLIENYEAGKR